MMKTPKWLFFLIATALLSISGSGCADDRQDAQNLVREAEATLRNFVADPNLSWFRDNIKDAQAIVIVPALLKAGFIFGASGGNGVVLARDRKTGGWSPPAFYTLGSVTWGLQIGGEMAEIIMLVMTDSGMRSLLSTKLQLGGDASIAAGPVGTGAQAATVDILQFARSKGIFGGLTLEGAVITPRDDYNSAFYGRTLDPLDVLVRNIAVNPLASPLRELVGRAASSRNR